MKLSIVTTITNPDKYQYAWREALLNFCSLADEVVVVNGGESISLLDFSGKLKKSCDLKEVLLPWPEEWHWRELPLHLNAGLAAASGDWVLKMDIDYLIHEADFPSIRAALEAWAEVPIISFVKLLVVNRFRSFEKTILPFCINKRLMGEKIQFGECVTEKTDWCYPLLVSGKRPDGVPQGVKVPEQMARCCGIRIWDYDYFFRAADVAQSEFWRFAKAYATAFDKSWGDTQDRAWEIFCKQYRGRLRKFLFPLLIESHPEVIRDRIRMMKPEEFGYDNWGEFKV